MTVPTRDDIRSGIKRLSGLSPAVQAILPRLGDEALGAHELGSMISQDPILAARVLHLANSPFYGLSRQVGSLDEAVLILGVSHLRGMVLTTGLIGLFADTDAVAHSLGTAAAAASLAKSLKQDSGTALTAGLLHNLGALLLGHFASDAWQSLPAVPPEGTGDRLHHEKKLFGFDHCELGADIAGDWHFPERICAAIRLHVTPSDDTPDRLIDLVHVAWVVGAVGRSTHAGAIHPGTLSRMGLASDTGEGALEAAREAAQESLNAMASL
ncbi:MAG: HDOD domain-containing protein [Thiobacillus sp.]|nr:HDOD domain-containing protein [Thiobacillus sp.]